MCAGEECLSDGYQAPAVLIPSLPGLSPLRACCVSAFLDLTLGLTSCF